MKPAEKSAFGRVFALAQERVRATRRNSQGLTLVFGGVCEKSA